MNEHATPPPAPPASESLRPVACLELKGAALLLFTLLLIVGSGLYLLYARGGFEPTQTVILTADDSEGVVVGMDMTFSGFPIGRVRRANIRAYSGILSDPPLPDGAERPVLGGDVGAEVPRLLSAARDLLNNLSALSAPDAALGSSLAQIKTLTERLNGPDGALGVLLGNAADARQLPALL